MAHGTPVWRIAAVCLLCSFGATFAWQNDPDCGTNPAHTPSTNIIGGGDSAPGEWPWHAAILVNEQQVRCGATIIDPEWVITAANCIGFKQYPEIYSVVGGLTDLRTGGGNQQLRSVSEIYINPDYDWRDNDYDIVALKLDTPFAITDYVRTICVPDNSMEDDFTAGTPCEVTGWGSTTETGYIYPILQKMNVELVEQTYCQNQYPDDTITDRMICAGEIADGKDTCNFDGGGPLMSNSFNKWYLVGVISSQSCGDNSGIFTRITEFENWLTPIFDGNDPITHPNCDRFQFLCPDGWCADYTTKCNGVPGDGCKEGGDERLCEGYNKFFDPYLFDMHLDPSSIVASFPINDNVDCSRLCLTYPDNEPPCLAFDVITNEAGAQFPYTCNMAGDPFFVVEAPFNQSILHFEIETFPTPNEPTSITDTHGRFATTRFILDENIVAPTQYWAFEHGLTGTAPGMIFRFATVHDNNACANRLTIKNGPDVGDNVVFDESLCDLPLTNEGIFVSGATGNFVEYIQDGPNNMGFVATYTAVTYCDGDFTDADGNTGEFSSPNYPNAYPEYSYCKTLITAPVGSEILVKMEDFMLEPGHEGLCDTDKVSVYSDDNEDPSSLMGEYCGETFPEYIKSPGRYLYFVFRSDGLIQHKGFHASYEFITDDQCGIRTVPLMPETNIIGGKDAQVGEWPWQGALIVNQVFRCGAVLIDPEWVLTTASCIDSYVFPEVHGVLMGINALPGGEGNTQYLMVEEIFVNPNYKLFENDYNIALLKMSTPFTINDHVRTVCLPNIGEEFPEATKCTVTGWGNADGGGGGRPTPNQYLQEMDIGVALPQTCADAHPEYGFNDARMICAGSTGKDTCNFDLGGAMVTETADGEYVLAGLVATDLCQDGVKPGVYTEVSAFRAWIDPIFVGTDPDTLQPCTRNEYECPGGWCTTYDRKCNGVTGDGCKFGGDENFCDDKSEFFDPFLFHTKLTDDSVETVLGPVQTLNNCGFLCTNAEFLCLAFDVEILGAEGYNCHLSMGRDFQTETIALNRSVVHFEIETTPQSGEEITIPNGKINTPRFDPEYAQLPVPTTLRWVLNPSVSGLMPGIVFRFPFVEPNEADCERVTIIDVALDTELYDACLSDLDMSEEGVFVPLGDSGVRLEFTVSDWEAYGFIAKFDSVTYCSGELTSPGYFSSPNYPNPYPSDSLCSTKITSPPGTRVSVFMEDFQLEMDPSGECIDRLEVYDSDMADMDKLVGWYCGSYIPPVFTASGESLFFVFRSDSALNYRGFNATFEFGEDGSVCGEQRVPMPKGPGTNIIGGDPADEGEYPWQALLLTTNAARCGAALLTPSWIVTTASCMDTPNYPELNSVVMGLTDLGTNSDEVQVMGVEAAYVHPDYDWRDNDNDIALLKLRTPFRITDHVRTICNPPEGTQINPGPDFWATGWGSTQDGERLQRYLQEIQLDVVSRVDCQAAYPGDTITDNMVCASAVGKDTCNFDQGGPFMYEDGGIWYQAGVISSQNCDTDGKPGIYTSIPAFYNWTQPIYEDGVPETIAECTYEEFSCPEGWCTTYDTKCNGLGDGCRYAGEETSCVGYGEYFDPFLFNVRLDESSIVETQMVSDSAECAQLCLEKDYICLAVDITYLYPDYTCHFAGETYEALKVDFDFSNTNLQIEKFRLPFDDDPRDIEFAVGKVATPRWIPSISSGNNFRWKLTTDLATEGRGYLWRFTVVKSKEEDPRLCQNYAAFHLASVEIARYCLNQVPEMTMFFPIEPYNTLEIELQTEDGQQYGFIGKYAAVTNCDQVIEGDPDTTGTFTSPNYPEMYPPESYCTTRLTAPDGYNVKITITDFQLEGDNTLACENDFDTLSLYDGRFTDEDSKIGVYCGNTIAEYYQSSGIDLIVQFKSDAFLNYKGFEINYEFVPVQDCHNNFYGPQGTWTSPLYPENYPADADCPTRITAGPDHRVLVAFLDVELEQDTSPGCQGNFDTISIYDSYMADEDRLLGVLCDTNPTQKAFVSSGDSLFVPFKSDGSLQRRGFQAVFYTFPALSSCDNVFTTAPNTFMTPGYPDPYPNRITCNTLAVAPAGYVVKLSFLDFELEGPTFNDECIWDMVNIYNSVSPDPDHLIGSYCGNKVPLPVFSTNTTMYVVFSSDESTSYKGFEALVEFVSADELGCDTVFTNTTGMVTSPLYPQNYPNGIVCNSLFVAPQDMIVRIEIQDFLLERNPPACEQDYDWLKIYDASEEDKDRLLGQFCGNSIPGFFESTGPRMYMVFKSDGSVSSRGFSASYEFRDGPKTIPPPPPLDDAECGKQTAPMTNIIGGGPAEEGEWPWQGGLLIRDESGDDDFKCGATLLDATWAVTAAHCLDVLIDPTLYTVFMGTNNLAELSDNIQMRAVEGIYVHPEYFKGEKEYDIALLKTERFSYDDYVRPVCTAPSTWEEYLDPDVLCTATGWGYITDGGFQSYILNEVEMPIYDRERCQDNYPSEPITDNMICAGYPWGGRDTCLGDDGGPLVAWSSSSSQWALVGVISWGEGCARENQPRVLTRITAFEEWIAPIYTGGEPDAKIPECPYDRFLCADGWCIDYDKKCDGTRDCYNSDDEAFCEGDTLYFDFVASKQLRSDSIRNSFTVGSSNECAERCIEDYIDVPCLGYQTIVRTGNMFCEIATEQYTTQPNTGSYMFFQIENMPCPNDIIQTTNGRFGAPKWTPLCDWLPNPTDQGDFYWIFTPPPSDDYNRIMIEFGTIHNTPFTDCSSAGTTNRIVIKSGPGVNDPIVGSYCLNELPDSVMVSSPMSRVEFYTVDYDIYGFLGSFNAFYSCDNEFTIAPGVFTSPNYPDNYPNGAECNTMIMAPEDMQVFMFMREFDLEPQGGACRFEWDLLRVYEGPSADPANLIGTYCGSDVPYFFRSEGRSLYVSFKSDLSINYGGFEAAYYFVPADATLPPPGNSTDACGVQTLPMEPEDMIVGGKPAQRGEYPWQVAIYYFNFFICGGVMISPEWVLTTASCVPSSDNSVYDIVAGSNNIEGNTDQAQFFTVTESIIHPQFDFAYSRFDIAMLRLNRNATIGDFVRTVCLPSEQDETDFPAGTMCWLTGWGSTEFGGPYFDELQEVPVSIIDQAVCQAQYAPSPVTPEMMCAGNMDGGQGACRGDAGSPLVSEVDNKFYLLGMPSWSRGCADPGYPAVYTRVSVFEDWIDGIIRGNYTEDLVCHANYTEAPGAYTSPFYPKNYPNNADCDTLISAPEGYNVYITIRDFLLEDDGSQECRAIWDSLSVYDSYRADEDRLLGTFCGDEIPRSFRSTGRHLFTSFVTDGSVTEKGYDIAYYFVQDSGCNSEFTVAPGSFSSPNYPDDYPNESECKTLVTAPEGQKVFLVMQDFKLEFDEGCNNDLDTLTVYDSFFEDPENIIGVYCGEEIPETFTSSGENMFVVFKSDKTTTARGFQAAYYFLPEMMTTPTPPGPPEQPYCGTRTAELGPEINLVGGSPAEDGEYPWHGALMMGGTYACGAALLTMDWAITSASCVLSGNTYTVLFGTTNLVDVTEGAEMRNVAEVFIHPEFDEESLNFDVALLKLSNPMPRSDHIRTICAPPADMNFNVGTGCYVTGWGSSTNGGPIEEELHELSQSIKQNSACSNEFFPPPTDNHLCAGENPHGPCNGDQGGPLVTPVDGVFYIVGLATRTSMCGDMPSLYSRMTSYYDWLAPIFDGNDPDARPTPDPYEPIREELRDWQKERDTFMYLMYAFVGVIGALILVIFFTLYTTKTEAEKLEKKLNEQGAGGRPPKSQVTSTYSEDVRYSAPDSQ